MIGFKDLLLGRSSGVAILTDCSGSLVSLESWMMMMPFVTWGDPPESVSGLWSQLSYTNVTNDEG